MIVGVLGLGRMGGPIAARLARDHEVVAFDPARGISAARDSAGNELLGSAAGVAARSEVLVTVLPGPVEVRAALQDQGALAALAAGSAWLDLTSSDPRVTDELADAAAARGIVAVAAPMAGGPREAASGELAFVVAGAPAARDRVAPLLAMLGRVLAPAAGERPGQAHLVKLIANGLWFGQAVAVTEALLLGRAHGVEPGALRELLAAGPGGSAFLDRHAELLLAGDDLADFGLDRVVDELAALEQLAQQARLPHDAVALAARLHREALAEFGPVDGELLGARLIERRAAGLSGPATGDADYD